jgi:Na+-transporting methylmalonyl-CoA/oxaloacetate decarboxylase gamma subunit
LQGKFLVWILVGLATIALTILTIVLEKNLAYWIRRLIPQLRKRGGRPPSSKPIIVWVMFWLMVFIVIMGTAVASSWPVPVPQEPESTHPATTPATADETPENTEEAQQVVYLEEVDRSTIRALDQDWNHMWTFKVDGIISQKAVYDLDLDARNETIIGVSSLHGAKTDDTGKVIVITDEGQKIAEFDFYDPERPSIYAGASAVSPYYEIGDFLIEDLFGDSQPLIVASGSNGEYFSSKLLVLAFEDQALNIIAEYWHPGFLNKMLIDDLNGDGIKDIVVSASNNSFPDEEGRNPIGVFMISSDKIEGQGAPYWGDEPVGTELWYYLVQPSSTTVTVMGVEDWDHDSRLDVKAGLSDNCVFYINYEGEIIGQVHGSGCEGESNLIRIDTEFR